MKTLCLLLLSCAVTSSSLFGQKDTSFRLQQFNQERMSITKKSMLVLGSWGAVNIITGAIGASTSSGSQKYFHQMNLGWGVINTGLGALSLLRFSKDKNKTYNFSQSMQQQQGMEKLFLLNAGLDLAYVGAGAWMLEKSKSTTKKPERWKGFGNSLLIQGGFLFLFDGIMYSIHNKHGKGLLKQLDHVQVAAGPSGFSLLVGL